MGIIIPCPSCRQPTWFKRAVGWGTFFAAVLTGGLWLLAIPFYEKRCVICGTPQGASRRLPSGSKPGL